jgi:hypothetical protein
MFRIFAIWCRAPAASDQTERAQPCRARGSTAARSTPALIRRRRHLPADRCLRREKTGLSHVMRERAGGPAEAYLPRWSRCRRCCNGATGVFSGSVSAATKSASCRRAGMNTTAFCNASRRCETAVCRGGQGSATRPTTKCEPGQHTGARAVFRIARYGRSSEPISLRSMRTAG